MKRAESANRLRGKRNGITLLPVLLAFLSIASVLALLQAQEMAQMRVNGRLIAEHHEAMDRRALDALITGDLGLAMMGLDGGALPLDGTPVEMGFDGRHYELRLQDVEGLVDLYLAPPELMRAAGLPADRILRVRQELAETEPLGRLSSLAQTMSRMGIERGKVGVVTQLAEETNLDPQRVPTTLHIDIEIKPSEINRNKFVSNQTTNMKSKAVHLDDQAFANFCDGAKYFFVLPNGPIGNMPISRSLELFSCIRFSRAIAFTPMPFLQRCFQNFYQL